MRCPKCNHEFEPIEDTTSKFDFDTFWKLYPKRNEVKVGRKVAKLKFNKVIQTIEQYNDLLKAVKKYYYGCNGYPKDACRFLANDYWKDWISVGFDEIKKEVCSVCKGSGIDYKHYSETGEMRACSCKTKQETVRRSDEYGRD